MINQVTKKLLILIIEIVIIYKIICLIFRMLDSNDRNT